MNLENSSVRSIAIVAGLSLTTVTLLSLAGRLFRGKKEIIIPEELDGDESELCINRPPSASTGPSSPAMSPSTKVVPKSESDVLFFSILNSYNPSRVSPSLTDTSSTPSISEPSTATKKKRRHHNNKKKLN